MTEREAAYGVPCGKCGETVFFYHGALPKPEDPVILDLFTFATGGWKGDTIAQHSQESRNRCVANGCELTAEESDRTFDPRFWNEIRVD